jgi:uncharacterized SAM-binding protein YcdF (DUF218 family)
MEQVATSIIGSLIFPPGLILFMLAVGVLLLNKSPVLGKSVLWFGLIIFYLSSTPFVSGHLINLLETYPALDADEIGNSDAGAIVILSSERDRDAKEYGGDTVGKYTLLRCRYGAFLQRKTGLPILVSGGRVFDKEGKSLAQVMAEVLREDFQAEKVWLEDKSRTTGENALFSEKFLAQKNIDAVYLVTQAWHMPRSVVAFEKAGLKVIPAPTAFEGGNPFKFMDILPSANSMNRTHFALHEMVGAIWYKIRY